MVVGAAVGEGGGSHSSTNDTIDVNVSHNISMGKF